MRCPADAEKTGWKTKNRKQQRNQNAGVGQENDVSGRNQPDEMKRGKRLVRSKQDRVNRKDEEEGG
jgi:hypothetical protein